MYTSYLPDVYDYDPGYGSGTRAMSAGNAVHGGDPDQAEAEGSAAGLPAKFRRQRFYPRPRPPSTAPSQQYTCRYLTFHLLIPSFIFTITRIWLAQCASAIATEGLLLSMRCVSVEQHYVHCLQAPRRRVLQMPVLLKLGPAPNQPHHPRPTPPPASVCSPHCSRPPFQRCLPLPRQPLPLP